MSAPHPQAGPPDPEDVFDHLRREDGEHVGYIEMSADGRFIPYDRLWVRRGEAMDLDEAEAVLDAIGLRLLAEDWLLEEDDLQTGEASWTRVRIREIHRDRVIVARAMEDLSATSVAKSVDLIGAIELPLPTTRAPPPPPPPPRAPGGGGGGGGGAEQQTKQRSFLPVPPRLARHHPHLCHPRRQRTPARPRAHLFRPLWPGHPHDRRNLGRFL